MKVVTRKNYSHSFDKDTSVRKRRKKVLDQTEYDENKLPWEMYTQPREKIQGGGGRLSVILTFNFHISN